METTNRILNNLVDLLTEKFQKELENLPFKKNTRECLIDGFRQGCRAGAFHTARMLDVTIKE